MTMSTWCSKHVEAWNKLIIKFSASSWLILINKYIEMHGQQNIKISIQHVYDTFLILRRTEQDMIKNVYRYSCKEPVILVRYYWILNFLNRFSKKKEKTLKYQISWKSVHWEPSCSIRTDGRTDRHDEGNSRCFHSFVNTPKSNIK